ncbi:MAG: amidase, partial [Alphaproteobacteria bacterium]|nr:amidase [Alphaproteobacteria bacterium]
AVRRLAAAGMVLLGKTHTVQFAATIIGINHDQGTPHNPWHAEPHVPGGSSSGSGVAVGGGLAPMALGTDTGGSVRAPSSLCGTVGLKTTVGRVSRAGVYPLSWTLDSVGPLTRSVEDAALVYQALRGFDADDDTTLHLPEQDVLANLKSGVQGLRLAFGETMFFDDLDPEVEAAVRASGAVFRELGATVDGIELPEAAATREIPDRLAGIAVEAYHYNRRLLDDHADELDPVILWLALGKEMAAPDYFALLRRRAELRRAIIERLRDVDALLVPTTPMPARPVALVDADPASHDAHARPYARNTSTGNFLNLCAVSLPCGFTNDGLPIGLMIYAKPYHEEMALRVAHAYEQATDWHFRRPDLSWAS